MFNVYIIEKYRLKNDSRENSRHIVATILKNHLGLSNPPEIMFDKYGKPSVNKKYKINFSYSHSNTLLVVVTVDSYRLIGIDTEPFSRYKEICDIRHNAFTNQELSLLHEDQYVDAWCLKEASVKMIGRGFLENNPSELSFIKHGSGEFMLFCIEKEITNGFMTSIIYQNNIIAICSTKKITKPNLIICNHKVDLSDTININTEGHDNEQRCIHTWL